MRRLWALVLAAAVLLVPGVAGAATSLTVTPTTTPAGSTVHVTGNCGHGTVGFVISNAFLRDASHEFAGEGAVSFTADSAGAFTVDAQIPADRAPGRYSVTARCGGGNLGIEDQLTVTAGGVSGVAAGSGGQAATGTVGLGTWLLAAVGLVLAGFGARLAVGRVRR